MIKSTRSLIGSFLYVMQFSEMQTKIKRLKTKDAPDAVAVVRTDEEHLASPQFLLIAPL